MTPLAHLLVAVAGAGRDGHPMNIPKASRRTYGKSLRAICKRLKLLYVKVKSKAAP